MIQAMDLPVSEQQEFLKKQCQDDSDLFSEVTELLNQNIADDFLRDSALADIKPHQEELSGEIGRIQINSLIAHGGMGDVYSGTDTLLGRSVAIKILSPEIRMSEQRKTAFLNEAKILSSLHHPNICQVYDFFEEKNQNVLVMELIEGKTLRDLLAHSKSVSIQSIELAIQIISALVAAHERGIIHHDLKPENIMVDKNGQVKVLDFGLAQSEKINSHESDLTLSGTPGYMSPEQANGEASGTSSDLWSFGLVLMELLTGNKHFPKDYSTLKLIEDAQKGYVEINQKLPKAEKALLRKLLSKTPNQRPSARETLTGLLKIRNRGKRRLVSALSLFLIILSISGIWKYTTDLQHERELALNEKNRAEQARIEAEDLIAFMLDDLNSGLQSVGRLDLMESVAQKARGYYNNLDEEQLLKGNEKPALTMIRIAEVLDLQGHKNDALQLLKQAVDSLQQLLINNPDNEMLKYSLGLAEMNLAEIYKLTGDFGLSQSSSQKSIDIAKDLTKSFQPGEGPDYEPDGFKRWKILLHSLYLHADVHMRTGHGEKAVVELEQAVQLAVPAVKKEPELSIQLANIQFKRCDTYYDLGLHDLVLEPCLATMKADKQLLDSDPENYQLNSNYLMDHVVLGRVYRSLKRFDNAVTTANQGIQYAKNIVHWDPSNSSSINDYASLLIVKGRSLYLMGERQKAEPVFRQALEILKPLLKDKEEITYINNAFTIYLHLGYLEQARKMAVTLKSKGFKRSEFLELCNEFDILECK